MKYMDIKEVEKGMVLAEDIYGTNNVIYITAGNTLTERMIRALGRLGLKRVPILESDEWYMLKDDVELSEGIAETLKEDLDTIVGTLNHFYSSAYEITDKVMGEIKEPIEHLTTCLTKAPKTLLKLKSLMHKDVYEIKHSVNVAMLSILISHWTGCGEDQKQDVALAGLLHDVGKTKIPLAILNKPTMLKADEVKIIRKHVLNGGRMIRKLECVNADVLKGVMHHHERLDGSGYPMALKEERIHEAGKIIAIADTYDALTSNRIHEREITPYAAGKILLRDSYNGKLDIKLSNQFIHSMLDFYIGSKVRLSTGEVGEVILNNRYLVDKPLIKIGDRFLDMAKELDCSIVEMVQK